jgi:glucan-binding YG repeat protein
MRQSGYSRGKFALMLPSAESLQSASSAKRRIESLQAPVQLHIREDKMSRHTLSMRLFTAIAAAMLAFCMMPAQAQAFTADTGTTVYVTRSGHAYHIYSDCPTLKGRVVTSIAFENRGSRDVCDICEARYERSGNNSGQQQNSQQQSAGWVYSNGGWWYRNADGSYPTSCWQNIGGPWYHFDAHGWMQTGWLNDGGTWYYLSGSGAMQTGWINLGGTWYYLFGSGAMVTGWQNLGGSWYYFYGSGAMATGWLNYGGTWYYLSGSGAMQTGWQNLGGAWYYFSASGAMQTGWINLSGVWYYLSASGAMATGWQQVSGSWYYFDGSGAMLHDCWVGNYYLGSSGAMLTNAWTPDGYYVGSDGKWIPAGIDASYESILSDYSARIAAATPGLVAEYNAEYSAYSTIDGRAKLCNEKVGKLAKICNDGVGEMAKHHLAVGDSYSTYEEWAGKLQHVYMKYGQQIQDAYTDSCYDLI